MGSDRECDSADIDEECGNTPPRNICDYPGPEGHCSGESPTRGTETDPSECQFFLGWWALSIVPAGSAGVVGPENHSRTTHSTGMAQSSDAKCCLHPRRRTDPRKK